MDHLVLMFSLCLSSQGKNPVKLILHNNAVQAGPFHYLYNRAGGQSNASLALDHQLVSSDPLHFPWKYWFLLSNVIQLKKILDCFLSANTVLNSVWDNKRKKQTLHATNLPWWWKRSSLKVTILKSRAKKSGKSHRKTAAGPNMWEAIRKCHPGGAAGRTALPKQG